jgi:hypothetical protein
MTPAISFYQKDLLKYNIMSYFDNNNNKVYTPSTKVVCKL